jgi:hypothetical protein
MPLANLKFNDSLVYEPEIQDWVALKPEEKRDHPLTEEISKALDRFFFHHYCQQFRHGAFARANSSMFVHRDLQAGSF